MRVQFRVSAALLAAAAFPALADDAPVDLGTITVTATPFERSADELAQPVDVLHGEALDRRRGATLGDTLDGRPGISSADFGPGVGRPVIRGQGGPRVQVLENGLSSMDASAISGDHAVAIDPAHAEQIEIIKGPATLIYGSGASGGVVNVVDGRLPAEVNPGIHGRFGTRWLDNGPGRAGWMDLTAGIGEFALRLDLAGLSAGDIEIPGHAEADPEPGEVPTGRLDNSSMRRGSGSLTAAWIRPDRVLAASSSRLRSNYGIPPSGHEHGGHGDVRIVLEQQRHDLRGLWFDPLPGIERIRARFGSADYRHREVEDGQTGTRFSVEERELRADATHWPLAGWRGVFGLQHADRDYSAIGEEAFVPPVATRSTGLFLVEEHALGAGRVELGARIERVRHEARDNPDTAFSPVSLAAGWVRPLGGDHHLRLTATRSQRAPAAEELYAFGPHLASRSFERGDATLGLETSHALELGLDHHGRRLRWALSAFLVAHRDYVYQSEVDQGLNADGSGTPASDGQADRVDEEGQFAADGELLLLDYRQDDARFHGVEGSLSWRLGSGPRPLTLELRGDTVRGRIEDGPNLPRITPSRIGAAIFGGGPRWHAGLDLLHAFDARHLSPLETPTDGYTLLSADLEYTVPGRAPLTLFVRGRNLLGQTVRRHTSLVKDFAPLPGRTVLAGFELEFDL